MRAHPPGARAAVFVRVALTVLAACTNPGAAQWPQATIRIAVAPLPAPDLANACYGLELLNDAREPVWSASPVCADTMGDLPSAITFVGACDPTDEDHDGVTEASVVLTILDLYGPDGPDADLHPDVLRGWKNPCAAPYAPSGCRLATTCRVDRETHVVFNLTIMGEAEPGFFDLAISFAETFCSARVDCAYAAPDGRPLELVTDPATGERVQTVLWAFACTEGNGTGTAAVTYLYMDDLVLRCGDTAYAVSPSAGPSDVYPEGVGAPAPLAQAVVFEGREHVTTAGGSVDRLYWNVWLGLRPSFFAPAAGTAPSCVFETRATASAGALMDGATPADTNYAYVSVSVPINSGSAIACTQHGLGEAAPHDGVATAHTGPNPDRSGFASVTFGNVGTAEGGGLTTEPTRDVVDECLLPPAPCSPNAACTDLPSGFACRCGPGYAGDGVTCVDADGCAESPCAEGVRCDDVTAPGIGRTCGACLVGYAGNGTTCSDIDECALGTDACAPPNPFCQNTPGAFRCYATEAVGFGASPLGGGSRSGYVALAAGKTHTVALKGDGAVLAWGSNGFGESTVPADLGYVVAVAAGSYHSVALGGDGRVRAWGADGNAQTSVPDGLSEVVAIAAGGYHTVALRADGTVVAWGRNADGEATVPADLTGVVAIAAGAAHTVALTQDGAVVAWGASADGQTVVPAGLSDVVAIAAGAHHTVTLKADGTVRGWGSDAFGESSTPIGLTAVIAIAAGGGHTVALKADGHVRAWGRGSEGQTVVPARLARIVTIAIAAGGYHTVALARDGTLVGWGDDLYGQASAPPDLTNIVALTAGSAHTVALAWDGTVVSWGHDWRGQRDVPAGLSDVVAIAAGYEHTVALKRDRTVVAWGDDRHGQTTIPAGLGDVVAIAAGTYDTVALKADGTVVAWGDDWYGQTAVPAGLSEVVAIAAGSYHTVALKGDGSVLAWGYGADGQTAVPADLAEVVAIAAGDAHTIALAADGTVVAWGYGGDGQTTVPVGLGDVVAIAAGAAHSVALVRDGSIVAWGRDDVGQTTVPLGLADVVAIAAAGDQTMALCRTLLAPAPRVTAVSAMLGSAGDRVTVTGAHFERVVAVRASGHIVRWTIDSPTQLRFTVPSALLGGPIEVETVSGVGESAAQFARAAR